MSRGLHWFRNDLRLRDNPALAALLERSDQWLGVFVVDPRIWSSRAPRNRVRFLHDCLGRLSEDLRARDVPLLVRKGRPEAVLPRLLQETGATRVSFNAGSTPFARNRDAGVRSALEKRGARVLERRGDMVFAASEVRSASGGGYAVYTPYRKAWWRRWLEDPRPPIRMPRFRPAIPGWSADPLPTLSEASREVELPTGGEDAAHRRLKSFLDGPVQCYDRDRDRPDLDGTSRLSPYLRFGAISVRQCLARAEQAADAASELRRGVSRWLDELVWREFYAAILEEHPRVLRESYRSEYDGLVWNDDAQGFEAWCRGETGFPLVDAGMRQLRATGWMHNRVRMIVASFLTKDLLIDWREGERFFFDHLVDGDPASNNGGWQWAASTGTDAQPYFRIFNPIHQSRRWDPEGDYIRRWVPELAGLSSDTIHEPWKESVPTTDYPDPIVDHAARRELALERFRDARSKAEP